MNTALFYVGMVVAAILMTISLGYAVIYRRERGVRYFVGIMALRIIYASAVIIELQMSELTGKEWCRYIQQSALVLTVPMFIMFVLDLYHRDKWLRTFMGFLIFAPFLGWVLLILTDTHTGLVYTSKRLVNGYLDMGRTPLALGFNLLCFTIIAIGFFLVIRYIRRARPDVRQAGMWVFILCSVPVLFEVAKVVFPNLTHVLLPLSVYTGFLGMIMLWLIIRHQMFSIVPMARDHIIETRNEGFLIVDHIGRIVDHNAYMKPLLCENEAGMLTGRSVKQLLADWPAWEEACIHMQECRLEIEGRSPYEDRVFILDIYPLFSQRGRKHGTVSVLFDITEKQRHLEEIAQLNHLKDQLFTVVSHDIRDPLALQVNLIELLEDTRHSLKPDQREIVDTLSEQIHNTYTMVENLLDWFRVQRTGFTLRNEWFNLAELVHEVLRSLSMRSDAKRVQVDCQVPAQWIIQGDREATLLIVRNLLSNAIKFSYRGGRVYIYAESHEQEWRLAVRDEGVGMDEQRLSLMFDDTNLDTLPGTEGEKGAGLGLMISRHFLHLSGGRLQVNSAPGQGSTFCIVMRNGDELIAKGFDSR